MITEFVTVYIEETAGEPRKEILAVSIISSMRLNRVFCTETCKYIIFNQLFIRNAW